MLNFHRTGCCLDFKSTVTRCPLPPRVPRPHLGGEVVKIAVREVRLLLHNVPGTTEPAAGSCLIPRMPRGRVSQGAASVARPRRPEGGAPELESTALREGATESLPPSLPAWGSFLSLK